MPARPITFTYPSEKSCAINIDFEGHEYILIWDGDWRKLPDLTHFPCVEGASVTLIPHSSTVRELWTRSQVLTYGADSHIRTLHSCRDDFPICKVAINGRQRSLLQEEFSILCHLSSIGVPVVRTHREPLTDEEGIFGFRMERLDDIDLNAAAKYIPDIETAINKIHQSGVVHHDISPSNIMLDQEGCIRIIDFGRAGYIGDNIPPYKNKGIKLLANATFSIDADKNSLKETISMFICPKGDLTLTLITNRYIRS
jgi:serine/threonine protein kinase